MAEEEAKRRREDSRLQRVGQKELQEMNIPQAFQIRTSIVAARLLQSNSSLALVKHDLAGADFTCWIFHERWRQNDAGTYIIQTIRDCDSV